LKPYFSNREELRVPNIRELLTHWGKVLCKYLTPYSYLGMSSMPISLLKLAEPTPFWPPISFPVTVENFKERLQMKYPKYPDIRNKKPGILISKVGSTDIFYS